MPLPLVPAVILALSALAGGTGTYKTVDAALALRKSREKYERRRKLYEEAENRYVEARDRAEAAFRELGTRRLVALSTLGDAVAFLRKARIKDRELEEGFNISQHHLAEWEGASVHAVEVLGGIVGGTGAGVATASAAYGLVGTLATASTGTAISSLSGAAATNATLAWLGGGSLAAGGGGVALGGLVLNGVVAGPALLVAGFFAAKKAEEAETEVAKQIAEMDVAETKMEQQLAVLDVVVRRVRELYDATEQVDVALKELLAASEPSNMDQVYNVARTAKALGSLLDVAILDSTGTIVT